MQGLGAIRSIDQSGIFICPWLRRLGRQPAILSGRGAAIGNALECKDTAIEKSADLSVLRLADGRARRRAVSRPLVGCSLDAVGSKRGLACSKADPPLLQIERAPLCG